MPKFLETALDAGLTEFDFWNMTIAEVTRQIESYRRQLKYDAQQKAIHNYILADLIGASVSRIYNKSSKYPELTEVYPTLFDSEIIDEKKEEQRTKASIARFMQFAQNHNQKYRG